MTTYWNHFCNPREYLETSHVLDELALGFFSANTVSGTLFGDQNVVSCSITGGNLDLVKKIVLGKIGALILRLININFRSEM
jgi:hypothetical protein